MLQEVELKTALNFETPGVARRAQSVVEAAQNLGPGRWSSIVRAWCVPFLFENMERIFAAESEPIEAINQSLETLAEFLVAARRSGFGELRGARERGARTLSNSDREVEEVTGEHYGRLFQAFSDRSFWDEPARLLAGRLYRNGVSLPDLTNKSVLDAGCGGGRYTVAWRQLGARPVTGVDISASGIADARRRVGDAGVDGVDFRQGSVLELPFGDDAFDIVFSNGVLHHTTDWRRGVEEIVRVLKPGGLGWLYLIERPGGLFWDVIDVLRLVMRNEPRDEARDALRLLGVPANRIFYMLDHVMVPINVRLTPDEIEGALCAAGAARVRRLTRGSDFDRVEQIFQGKKFAAVKYGVGENRFVFTKE